MKLGFDSVARLRSFNYSQATSLLAGIDTKGLQVLTVVWAGALALCVMASMEVSVLRSVHDESVSPSLVAPRVLMLPPQQVNQAVLEQTASRLRRLSKKVEVDVGKDGGLAIHSKDPSSFRDWIIELTSLETMAPQVRWRFTSLCVGSVVCQSYQMSAEVVGEVVSFGPGVAGQAGGASKN